MARILILRECPSPRKPLRHSLGAYHELYFATNMAEAVTILLEKQIDLIISSVHMDDTNTFDVITTVRSHEHLRGTPFVCFSAEDSAMSMFLNPTLERAALLCGADRYLTVNQFGGPDRCDLHALRLAIENVLKDVTRAGGESSRNARLGSQTIAVRQCS